MIRAVVALFLLLLAASAVHGDDSRLPPEVTAFLNSRKVVATIEFGEGETALNSAARKAIDGIAGRLKQLDPVKTLVRIEGVASPGGRVSANVRISMSRASAVMDYLREKHGFSSDLSLTGFGAASSPSLTVEPGCRAEIAFYDNPWEMSGVAVEKTVSK